MAARFERPKVKYVEHFPDVFGEPSKWNPIVEERERVANALALAGVDVKRLGLERCLMRMRDAAGTSKIRQMYVDTFDSIIAEGRG